MWQVVNESSSGPSGYALATDPVSAIRLWIAVTVRQSCLLMVVFITLLHVRMAHPVSFGGTQWMVWAPTILLTCTSTAVAGILAGSGVESLFYGLTAYLSSTAVFTAIAIAFLVRTLFAIKKNLIAFDESTEPWPPVREVEDKARPSFGTEDIDAIKDGASWITSEPGSRRQSISTWSFSTHQTATTTHGRPQSTNHPSALAKSASWFGSNTPGDVQVPPVPPLPSPYGPPALTPDGLPDLDPFRREVPKNYKDMKARLGSQSSWLTSSDGSHTTFTTWSFPANRENGVQNADVRTAVDSLPDLKLHGGFHPPSPTSLSSAQVLGGYGFAPGNTDAENGISSLLSNEAMVGISISSFFSWLVTILLPLVSVPPPNIIAMSSSKFNRVWLFLILSPSQSRFNLPRPWRSCSSCQ
jgi:hypothetical protein